MRGLALAALLIAATSCDPEAARAVEACAVVCDCQPAAGADCESKCVEDVVDQIGAVPAACLTCIQEHRGRCLSLEAECFEGPCNVEDQPPQPGEPPTTVDAGVPPDAL